MSASPDGAETRRSWHGLAVVLTALVLSALGALAIAWGTTYLMPDNLHTDYGFPWTWGTHLTDSFAGPVDRWTVNLTELGGDLLLWFGFVVAGVAAIEALRKR